jgi:hypothetical protein
MVVNGGSTDPICGICAEDMIMKVHGVKIPLRGEIAVKLRNDAIKWRKQHPEDGPDPDGRRRGDKP